MRARRTVAAVTAVAALASAGCGDEVGGGEPGAPDDVPAVLDTVDLPAPGDGGGLSVEDAIASRRSRREFAPEPLTPGEVSLLLWSAQGVTEEGGAGRAAPSAGGTYPLEIYVVAGDGLFHYLPAGHRIEILDRADLRAGLGEAALGQQHVAEAAAVFVVTAVVARTEARYGDRAERYVHLEAGHAAQNVLLVAESLGLGAVPVGAFDDEGVASVLGIPGDHRPLYLIAVGRLAGE